MRVYRSPLKLFLFGIVGIVLIAAAADIGFGHWLSTPPDNNDGVLTTRGEAQQRGDLVWGGSMVAVGVVLFGGSVAELLRRKPTLVVEEDGIYIGSGSADAPGFIPWSGIEAISSDVARDPYDGANRVRLIIEKKPETLMVTERAGVNREHDTLYLDAHDWTVRVTDVALAAQGAHDHFARTEEASAYKPPSIEWEITIIPTPPDVASSEERISHDDEDEDAGESGPTEVAT